MESQPRVESESRTYTEFERNIGDYAITRAKGPLLTISLYEAISRSRQEPGFFDHNYEAKVFGRSVGRKVFKHLDRLTYGSQEGKEILDDVQRYIQSHYVADLIERRIEFRGPEQETPYKFKLQLLTRLPRSTSKKLNHQFST